MMKKLLKIQNRLKIFLIYFEFYSIFDYLSASSITSKFCHWSFTNFLKIFCEFHILINWTTLSFLSASLYKKCILIPTSSIIPSFKHVVSKCYTLRREQSTCTLYIGKKFLFSKKVVSDMHIFHHSICTEYLGYFLF